jgi:predicted RNA-binding protein with PUA-like domain
MANRTWLFKSEPSAYSYDDLVNDSVAEWDGVRNFQARNFLRDDVEPDDRILFYHSNVKPPAIMGTATVVRSGYPDNTAWNPKSDHPDPKSTSANPIWYMVDIKADECFAEPVTLDTIRNTPELSNMLLIRKGMRLSIQPVTKKEFDLICQMGKKT